jgi:hypothetical protein
MRKMRTIGEELEWLEKIEVLKGTKRKNTERYQMDTKLVEPIKNMNLLSVFFYNFYYLTKDKIVNSYCSHNQLRSIYVLLIRSDIESARLVMARYINDLEG